MSHSLPWSLVGPVGRAVAVGTAYTAVALRADTRNNARPAVVWMLRMLASNGLRSL
jgi:hypothetical protein